MADSTARSMRGERIATAAVLGALVLVAGAVAWFGTAAVPGHGEPGTVVYNVTGVGAAGVWTLEAVNGLNYWWKTFRPATLHATVGDEVVLNLSSADMFHRFYLPSFEVGPVDIEPGHMATVRFTADRAGVFQFYCTSMCGSCHFFMRGWLVVTAPGETPIEPPPISCPNCVAETGPVPATDDLVELGSLLYQARGCVSCHGPEGKGGVPNPNSTIVTPPNHDTTAQKLFLASREDADALIDLVGRRGDLDAVEEAPEVGRFPLVRVRWDNAEQIIRDGRYTSKLDPQGPEPPLQMPAWDYLLDEREIDALLAYFISLYDWEEI